MLNFLISYYANFKKIVNFNAHNNKYFKLNFKKTNNVILVEAGSDCSNHIAYSYITNELAKKYKARIIPIKITMTENIFRNFLTQVLNFFNLFYFNTYKSFNSEKSIIIKASNKNNRKIKFKSKKKLLKFKFKGILVGDLIYDSYLRYNFRNTLNLSDQEFINFTNKSINFFENSLNLFKNNRVRSVIMSHAVYLPAFLGRVAASRNQDSYCAGITHFIKLTSKHLNHHNYKDYKKEFNNFSRIKQKQAIQLAKIETKDKLNGRESANMENLLLSPFNKKNLNLNLINNSKKIKVLIASHCLIDSPHVFGNWFFPDFTEWLEFLGKISNETNYDWYLKPHPNNLKHNSEYINKFKNKYKNIKIIPHETSHYVLKNKIDFVLTVWGNIAMDLALLNLQVINANPNGRFSAFNFNHNPKNVSEYKYLIKNLDKVKKIKIFKNEIYKCFYMHYIYNHSGWLIDDYVKTMRKLGFKNRHTYKIYDWWIKNFNKKKHENIKKKVKKFIYKDGNTFLRLK